MGRKKEHVWGGINDGTEGVFDEEAWRAQVIALAIFDGTIAEQNYPEAVRSGGEGNYDRDAVEARRARNGNGPEEWMEERAEDSVNYVVDLLSDGGLFPWIEEVVETERWSSEDVEDKTDLVIYIKDNFVSVVGRDALNIQIKSSWHELVGAGEHGRRLLGLKSERWRELGLIVLIGQDQCAEAIVGSFLIQVMNHLGIYGNEQLMAAFLSTQSEIAAGMVRHYLILDIAGRDWGEILEFVRGRGKRKRVKEVNGTRVSFY